MFLPECVRPVRQQGPTTRDLDYLVAYFWMGVLLDGGVVRKVLKGKFGITSHHAFGCWISLSAILVNYADISAVFIMLGLIALTIHTNTSFV